MEFTVRVQPNRFTVFSGFFFGLTLIILGSVYLNQSNQYSYITDTGKGIHVIFIVLGTFTVLLSMICLLLVKEDNSKLAYFKFTLTCFIVLFLFGLSTCVAVFNGQLTHKFTGIYDSTSDLMKLYEKNAAQNLRMDQLQQDLSCCGSNNYTDWFAMHAKLCQEERNRCVPKSCCILRELQKQKPSSHMVSRMRRRIVNLYTGLCRSFVEDVEKKCEYLRRIWG